MRKIITVVISQGPCSYMAGVWSPHPAQPASRQFLRVSVGHDAEWGVSSSKPGPERVGSRAVQDPLLLSAQAEWNPSVTVLCGRHLARDLALNFRSIPRAAYFQIMLPRKSKQCRAAMIYLTMNHSLKNYQLWKAFTTLGIMQWCISCESVQSVSMATPSSQFANSWGNRPGRVAENKPAYYGFLKEKSGLFWIASGLSVCSD